jgi:hypothetical protein
MIDQLGGRGLKSVGQGYGDGYDIKSMEVKLSGISKD